MPKRDAASLTFKPWTAGPAPGRYSPPTPEGWRDAGDTLRTAFALMHKTKAELVAAVLSDREGFNGLAEAIDQRLETMEAERKMLEGAAARLVIAMAAAG